MSTPTVAHEVAKRFYSLRRRFLAVRVAIAVAIASAVMLLFWISLAVGDYVWEWPRRVRQVGMWLGIFAVLAWLAWRLYDIFKDSRRQRFVGRIESAYKEFGQRIRTVLETVDGRIYGPSEMLAALGHQTLGRWETVAPSRLVPSRALAGSAFFCLSAVVVAAGLFTVGGDWKNAMLRTLGSELPYTTLTVTPGNVEVLEGMPVEVSLELAGRTDRDCVLRYRELRVGGADSSDAGPVAHEWIERELLPAATDSAELKSARRAVFAADLGQAAAPIEYQFVTTAGSTPIHKIDVQPLIEAERIDTLVTPPAYTQLDPRSFTSSDVTVLEQSEVTVTVHTNHPLAEATLQLGARTSDMRASPVEQQDDATQWSFQLSSLEPVRWHFSGRGIDGTPVEAVEGRLRVLRDRAPVISWRDPPDEIRVHTLAELPLRTQVADDYGVTESGIVFQLGGEEYELTNWTSEESDAGTTGTTRVRLEETLPLESFGLSERDFIAYYAYAVDNRGSGPQRSESDVRYIDIRPLRQFFSEDESEPGAGAGGQVLVQLSEIIRWQRFLINRTRKLIHSTGTDLTRQLGTIDRLAESQSELAGLTRVLAEFFVSRGNDDVEALNQAEAAMLQATDSLSAGSFDLTLVQQEDALRALAEARRTLEIVLRRNMASEQRKALLRLARQLRQKLRNQRPETEQEIADTIQRIAAEQQRLGRMASDVLAPPDSRGPAGRSDEPQSEVRSAETADGEAGPEAPEGDAEALAAAEPAGGGERKEEGAAPEAGGPASEARAADESAPSGPERREQLLASQVDLLERLQDIEVQLIERLESSPLMAERMEAAKEAFGSLVAQAREDRLEQYAEDSAEAADALREMGIQLDALAPTEPVSRILAIRDLTASLAGMESDLAAQLRQAAVSDTGKSPSESEKIAYGRMAVRMKRRTATVADVLKAPEITGNIEASEVNDSLEEFVEEVEFLDQLSATEQATERVTSEAANAAREDALAFQRAADYSAAAQRLDDMYRQLVTPRLARLRQMEQQATTLAQELGSGQTAEESAEAEVGRLQAELKQEGLNELAAALDEEYWDDAPPEDGSTEGDQSMQGLRSVGAGGSARRVQFVARELQARIQEMILLEISADRDAPVPSQYRTAVDRYFSIIADRAATSAPEANGGR